MLMSVDVERKLILRERVDVQRELMLRVDVERELI